MSNNYNQLKNSECSICFYDIGKKDNKIILENCNHTYHYVCLIDWYNKPNSHYRCPDCSIQRDIKNIIYHKQIIKKKKFPSKDNCIIL